MNWRRKFFSLTMGVLEVVENEEQYKGNVRKGKDRVEYKTESTHKLVGAKVILNPDPMALTLELYLQGGNVMSLRCDSPGEQTDWHAALSLHIYVAHEDAITDPLDDSNALYDWFMGIRSSALEASERLKRSRTYNKRYPVLLGLLGSGAHPKDVCISRDGKSLLCGPVAFVECRPNPYALPDEPSVGPIPDKKKSTGEVPKVYKEYPLSTLQSITAPMDKPLDVVLLLGTGEKSLVLVAPDVLLRDRLYKDLHLVVYYASLVPFRRDWATGNAKRGVDIVLENAGEAVFNAFDKTLEKTNEVFKDVGKAFSKDGDLAKVFGKDGVLAHGMGGALSKVGIKTKEKRPSQNEAQIKVSAGIGAVTGAIKGAAKSAGSALKNLDKDLS